MDSCGSLMLRQQQASKRSDLDRAGRGKVWISIAHAACGLILLSLLAGCVTMKFGSPPVTDNLKTLKVGASTSADVLLALGQPRGDGAARFPVDPNLRKIWFYDYVEAAAGVAGSVTKQKILLVFFNREKYDGYLWFSSITEATRK